MSFLGVRGLAGRSWFAPLSLVIVQTLSCAVSAQTAAPEQAAAFTRSLAATAESDEVVAAWYRETGYDTLWTGADDAARRAAFLTAIARAAYHGLPVARYDAAALIAQLRAAETEGDRGRVEVEMTRAYLAWARDLTSGALDPKTVDAGIVREIDRIDPKVLLTRIANGNPEAVLKWLEPKSTVYLQLMKAKFGLEAQIAAGGWGEPVAAQALGPGDTGPAVVALRDRLVRMGYLAPTSVASYDRGMQAAVAGFQLNHGLTADGVANASTLDEINIGPEARLKSVIVAMERERWMHIDRSVKHVWVNLPDFKAKIIDGGKTIFETRVVIGKNVPDQRSPEFSDQMEHMVINPSWGVPRSIIVKEYLPLLQKNPNAVGHLQVVDGRGRVVSRGSVNFAAYNARNFPFALRQPPSDGNALGKVKFMFPNPYNIYLHDTPSKSLFAQEVRAYSHGCIRVADPFDLAHELLSWQSDNAEEEFEAALKTGKETTVKLKQVLPVHLVYFTAYPDQRGRIGYRRDVYGRDAALWEALQAAGVELAGVQG
ncbi:L,D-transpeptidase family protein [Tabrizicola thermarum]|uniref:L,D-transpeptidase family protein n=1 Tax=Tabrizicola thermarum TaxID=2670345 RepID=UPI000FFC86FA|nr:L,D-transpeptidase family protein [Tabrizicola thermarum]